jgi:DNA-binding MarR family transcriptional regulator
VVHLTQAGRKLIECAFREHAVAMEAATSGLTAAERGEAVTLLKKLGLSAAHG